MADDAAHQTHRTEHLAHICEVDGPQVVLGAALADAADHHAADAKPWPATEASGVRRQASGTDAAAAIENPKSKIQNWFPPPIAASRELDGRLTLADETATLAEKLRTLASDGEFARLVSGIELGRFKPLLGLIDTVIRVPGTVGSPTHIRAFCEAALRLLRAWAKLRPGDEDHEFLSRIDHLLTARGPSLDAVCELFSSVVRRQSSVATNHGQLTTDFRNAASEAHDRAFTRAAITWPTVFAIVQALVKMFHTFFSNPATLNQKAPAMSTGTGTGTGVSIPALPPVDPAKHPRLANIVKLIETFGPWVLTLLKAFGVNVPISLPSSATAQAAKLDHDACERALAGVDQAHLEAAVKEAGL